MNGKDSAFNKEIKRGDWIIALDGTRGQTAANAEKRKVNFVFSDRSLNLVEAFSQDVITFSQYDF